MTPRYFKSNDDFHQWLAKNHAKAKDLVMGFRKKHTGMPSVTYQEALDLALAFGWIDGVRHKVDEENYTIRFSPRRRGSIWSLVNIKRVAELKKLGLMQPAGLKAFETRDVTKAERYSYERKTRELDKSLETLLRANRKAFAFYEAQPPSYRRVANWFVMSAKQEQTRHRRLAKLIEASQKSERLGEVTSKPKKVKR